MIDDLKTFAQNELYKNILPFWSNNTVDEKNGGFVGKIDEDKHIDFNSDKGLILNARILWTFSAACRRNNDEIFRKLADRAYNYIIHFFYDKEYKGFFWKLDYKGNPADTKKQVYAEAFVIYALSEYYLLTGLKECLDKAIETFELIEKYSFDPLKKGYFEAFDRKWQEIGDLRLSTKDMNEKKTMNTHLHVLEAYTNFYRIYKNEKLKNKIISLLEVFYDCILDKADFHYNLFFDENWNLKSDNISYGHDIEGSWLMLEAAEVIEDEELINKFKQVAINMAQACLEGIHPSGSLSHDVKRNSEKFSKDTEWWVQAEAVVGFHNAYKLSGKQVFLNTSINTANFIQKYIIDPVNGEWFGLVTVSGERIKGQDKAGFWKCPYHNARMCLEILERA